MAAFGGLGMDGSMAGATGMTLFVGNLAWETGEEDLTQFMSGVGNVTGCEVQRHADTGRSKGWALVTFASPDEASYAMQQLNTQEMNGRKLNVREDRSQINHDGTIPVYVGNLPWATTREELQQIFAAYNPIDVHVKTTMSGRSRGFAILRFAPEMAAAAIQNLDGYELGGAADGTTRSIEVREDRQGAGDAAQPPRRKNRSANQNGGGAPPAAAAEEVSSNTLFVGNLNWDTDDDDLFQHFQNAGIQVVSAKVQRNDKLDKSKGWGLVTYSSVADAEAAKSKLNGSELDSRPIKVKFDQK